MILLLQLHQTEMLPFPERKDFRISLCENRGSPSFILCKSVADKLNPDFHILCRHDELIF